MTSPNSNNAGQYSGISPFFGAAPSWVTTNDDKNRIRAYQAYEDIYWCVPDALKVVLRGTDQQPVYLPNARKIVEATNRFLAQDFGYIMDRKVGSQTQRDEVSAAFDKLFKREEFYSKFAMQRRYGLIRGDAIWHITADPGKPQGERISIHDVDPSNYFPIVEDDNVTKIIGVHIVDTIPDPRDSTKTVNRRQTYRKHTTSSGMTTITSELGAFEIGKWDDRDPDNIDLKPVPWNGAVPERTLPGIAKLPVYNVINNRTPGSIFGSSEIRGIETVIASIDQTISDEELTLAMQGLGMYWTDAGPPLDDNGNEVPWDIGPARVAEVPSGQQFGRVNGVGSVTPMIDHMKYISESAQQGTGVPDIAAGTVDVAVAESGISLRFKMGPILAKNAEKEQEMLGRYDHMLYDLATMWLPQFEGIVAGAYVQPKTVVGDAMPVDRAARIKEIINLMSSPVPLITIQMAQEELTKLGYEFPDNATQAVLADAANSAASISPDPFTSRLSAEQAGANGPPGAAKPTGGTSGTGVANGSGGSANGKATPATVFGGR